MCFYFSNGMYFYKKETFLLCFGVVSNQKFAVNILDFRLCLGTKLLRCFCIAISRDFLEIWCLKGSQLHALLLNGINDVYSGSANRCRRTTLAASFASFGYACLEFYAFSILSRFEKGWALWIVIRGVHYCFAKLCSSTTVNIAIKSMPIGPISQALLRIFKWLKF